ncbi:hypothetical protein CVO96_20070 [Deinococcus koreensis]|uniref:Insertion element IS402-like domain-containing protein n=1 Tax=Deinococcus koreensis TaxID=2054903 RepID=A0A2K3URP5_9DEIO|nr:hypothetical protein CVO96_20070 [Deinococcus koreensis]
MQQHRGPSSGPLLWMRQRRYTSDLTRGQFKCLEPLLLAGKAGGRPRSVKMYEVLCAILCVLHNGCARRNVPHGFPAWETVSGYFRRFEADGTWEAVNRFFVRRTRQRAGRDPEPSAGSIDSQTVRWASRVLRWVAQRSLAWLTRCRRLNRDFEGRCETAEAWCLLANIRFMLHACSPPLDPFETPSQPTTSKTLWSANRPSRRPRLNQCRSRRSERSWPSACAIQPSATCASTSSTSRSASAYQPGSPALLARKTCRISPSRYPKSSSPRTRAGEDSGRRNSLTTADDR